MKERIDGLLTDVEKLSDEEIANWKGYQLEKIEAALASITRLTSEQFRRSNTELPFDSRSNREHLVGRLMLTGRMDAAEAYDVVVEPHE